MAQMKVNDRYYDWGQIEISIDGVDKTIVSDIIEISYEEKEEIKPRYGLGSMPKGYAKGNIEFTGKITWNKEGFDKFILEVVKPKGYSRISQLPPVDINVHFLNDEQNRVITDQLKGVKFHSPKTGAKQGDTELTVETELFILDIKRGA